MTEHLNEALLREAFELLEWFARPPSSVSREQLLAIHDWFDAYAKRDPASDSVATDSVAIGSRSQAELSALDRARAARSADLHETPSGGAD